MPVSISGSGSITGLAQGGIDGTKVVTSTAQPVGSVIQAVSSNKTNYQSTQSGSYVDITGLSCTITPKFSTSKIFVQYSLQFSGSNNSYAIAKCVYNNNGGSFQDAGPFSDALAAGNGDALGNRQCSLDGEDTYAIYKLKERGCQFLHSPNSTNQLIYKLQMRLIYQAGSFTTYINRTADIANDPRTTGISNITVMEVSV